MPNHAEPVSMLSKTNPPHTLRPTPCFYPYPRASELEANETRGPCCTQRRRLVAVDTPTTDYELRATSNLYPYPRTRRHLAAEVREPALNLIQGPCCTNIRDFVAVNWFTTSHKLHATGQFHYRALRTDWTCTRASPYDPRRPELRKRRFCSGVSFSVA